jgi:L-alanine-DL-glutamate epimerase-like enolase superfamily enzyme
MVDANCPWTPEEALAIVKRFRSYDLYWLEEPIFPPEDFHALAILRKQAGMALAAGENACTVYQFRTMFDAGAVDFAQPSVTKVGGVTEFRKVQALAAERDIAVMPHSPYFGPGLIATLHLVAAGPESSLVERLYVDLEASLYGNKIDPEEGVVRLPDSSGLGFDPDPDVIHDYRPYED